MTLHEMSAKIIERGLCRTVDWAGVYDISKSEATRIAKESDSVEDFDHTWSNTDWWRDAE
jgi:hypothetical protein